MSSSRHVVVLFARTLASTALVVGLIAACSGSLSTIGTGGVDPSDSSSNSDGSTSIDGASTTDGSSTADSSIDGGGGKKDAGGLLVNEKPAPDCHDLAQHGSPVTPVGNPGLAPAQVPITTIAPGLYVLASATDYGGATTIDDPPSTDLTTVVFTATRQYYLSENTMGSKQALTLDWKISNNRLIRKILCAPLQSQIGNTVDYRIDAAPNGFIVYVPPSGVSLPTRIHAYRYSRAD